MAQLDRQRALDLLRPFQSDVRMIRELRTLLGSNSAQVNDRDVVTEIARKIETRDIIVTRENFQHLKGGAVASAVEEAEEPASAPPPRSRSGPAAPPPESPTLSPDTDGDAQAATAQAAAQSGAPFCEH